MDPATQIDGELIAKTEARRALELEAIERPGRWGFSWQYFVLMWVGAAVGYSGSMGSYGQVIAAVFGGMGFFLAANAYQEVTLLRRRMDALVALLKAKDALR